MSINPKSLKEIIKIKVDDFFYYFQNNNSYRLSIKNLVEYVSSKLSKENVGLENVDNTSDLDKPISNATNAEFQNVYNQIELTNNYVDISSNISGYEIVSEDANKLITNSNANVRTVIIPSSLALPNNTIFIKGRVAIQPEIGVNIELPDTTTITSPVQFTCEADKMYVLHRKQFTGDEWILVELGTVLLTDGSGTTANGLSIDLGGILDAAATFIKGSAGSASSLFLGGNAVDENLSQLMINAQSFILNQLTSYNGSGSGNIINSSVGGFISFNTLDTNSESGMGNIPGSAFLDYVDNRQIHLVLGAAGIPNGSGETFTVNGTTFTEGIDFTGQDDRVLDSTTLAALNYSGVTNFLSVTFDGTTIKFKFSANATFTSTLSNGTIFYKKHNTQATVNNQGVILIDGDSYFQVSEKTGEHTFNDGTLVPKGIKYAGNYDATLEEDSLVPKRFVVDSIPFLYDNISISPLTKRNKYRAIEFLEIVDDALNEESVFQIRASKLSEFTSSDIINVGDVFKLSLAEGKLYFGNIQGLAEQKTLTEVFETATEEISNVIFHVVDNKVELLVPTGEIIVGDALNRGRTSTIGAALDTLAKLVGNIFKNGLDNKLQLNVPPGYIIRGNANAEGEAQKLIQGNNKVLVTNESGVEEEVDLISFLDLLTATGVTANGVLNTIDLSGTARGVLGSWKITDVVIKNTTANQVHINLGTTPGGNDILNNFQIDANVFKDDITLLKSVFSETVEQAIYISSPNWNSASLIIKFSVKKIY